MWPFFRDYSWYYFGKFYKVKAISPELSRAFKERENSLAHIYKCYINSQQYVPFYFNNNITRTYNLLNKNVLQDGH